MNKLLILGGGTAGTMVANKLAKKLDADQWQITIVDKDEVHYYQPGFIYVPFGVYRPEDTHRTKRRVVSKRADMVFSGIEVIEPQANRVRLDNGQTLPYDILVIATGCEIRPDQIQGMLDGGWKKNVFDFYTLEGASALNKFLETWEGGRLVLNVAEMPIKCPVAPLEFVFLADWYFTRRGMRNKVDITYATPLPGAFTKPRASAALADMLKTKGIHTEAEFNIGQVDSGKQAIRSWDGREIPYDLLITIPTNMGVKAIESSGMGDDLNYIPTDKHTLQSRTYENVWVLGDATNLPTSKAGSVAHFEHDVVVENILRQIKGIPPKPAFDGHANCFIETGFNKGVMIDFNYEVEPLAGTYPVPYFGPFGLLKETPMNHLGKLSFRWIYWNILMPGRHLPVSNQMSMKGKQKLVPSLA
ncbi:MAG: FAD/NAD(P)-binding oxidoreductase [Anaerolineales bacterium]